MKRKAERKPNPIIAAMLHSFPKVGMVLLDVDRYWPPDPKLDWLIANAVDDLTIRYVGLLVVKALLLGDRKIERTLHDALKECDHIFKRDRARVLHKEVLKILPDLMRIDGLVAKKREIEKRRGKKLQQKEWDRLRKQLGWGELPTGRPKKSAKKRP